MAAMKKPGRCISCDTFVALPPATENGSVVFGKNSDRPSGEVQEVVYCEGGDHANGTNVQCTYIEVPQVPHTHAVILSKPGWMWGAEMGANELGVCIGNEAVATNEEGPQDLDEALLGMDLVRLGLERGGTAKEALDAVACLLEKYGQGGPCYEDCSWTYHNSFLIADGTEAWVLETAGKHWAAEKITNGVRNISNELSIRTKIDAMSSGLKEHAQSKGWWKPEDGDFDFAKAFGDVTPDYRYTHGLELLKSGAENNKFKVTTMFSILRDDAINFGSATLGSQVSVLPPAGSKTPASHWFTATPDPAISVFKPFVFCPTVVFTPLTQSPVIENDPAKSKPRFQRTVDRRHPLFIAHKSSERGAEISKTLQELEENSVKDLEAFLAAYDEAKANELSDLFKDVVESEMKFYSM